MAQRPVRALASLGRRAPRLAPQPMVLVICEDSKSCRTYLQEAAHDYGANLKVDVIHCGKTDPQSIVAEALDRAKKFDHVYCAIDRDDHPLFEAAVQTARQHADKISVRASFPSYEFWLLLHFIKTRRPYRKNGNLSAGDLVLRDLCAQEEMQNYGKGNSKGLFEKLKPRLSQAMKWADEVLNEAENDGNLNPSTTLHELLREFKRLGQSPQPAQGK